MTDDGRLFVVGIDGAPPALVREGIAHGDLPNIGRMADDGAVGTTRSTVPPISMMAWSTFATGRVPGNHGVFNFMLKRPGEYGTRFADADHLRRNAIPVWEYLDAQGVATGIVNVMPSYPVSRTRGYHVADHITAPSGRVPTFPRELEGELDELVDGFLLRPPGGYVPGPDEERLQGYLSRFLDVVTDNLTVAKHLVRTRDCRLTIVVFSGPDVLLHNVGHLLDEAHPKHDHALAREHGDAPFRLLALYDDFLGWLMGRMGEEDTLMVLSDHGHGSVYRSIDLNSLLYREGYLNFRSNYLTRLKLAAYDRLYERLSRVLKQLGVYDDLKVRLAKTSGGESGPDLASVLTVSQRDIDWENTVAFAVAGDGQLYINTSSEHDRGTVPPEDYESVRNRLRAALSAVRDPAGDDAVFESVLSGEEVYEGTSAEGRPDLVCVPVPTYEIEFPQTLTVSRAFGEPQSTSSHTSTAEMDGVFYAYGERVEPVTDLEIRLEDFAPTALEMLGVPVPAGMDGTVRTELMTDVAQPRDRAVYDGTVYVRRAVRSVAREIHRGGTLP